MAFNKMSNFKPHRRVTPLASNVSVPVQVDYTETRGNVLFVLLFLISLIFQISVIPFNLDIRPVGRLVNGVVLAVFAVSTLLAYSQSGQRKIAAYYTLPVLLIIAGFSLNIILSMSVRSLGSANILLPWLAAISIPFFKTFNCRQAWSVFYGFMFVTTVVSILEYYAAIYGVFTPNIVETTGGVYYKGILTIFTRLEDGEIYYRLYGVFSEPGTAAMYMLPAIAYSLFFRKWIGLCVFLLGVYLTDSLGGMFGLFCTILLYLFIRLKQKGVTLILVIIAAAALAYGGYIITGRYFAESYIAKNNSATLREDNVKRFLTSIPSSVSANPLGFRLTGESLSTLDSDENYYGSNFSIYTAFVMGGIAGLVGYTTFLITISIACIKYLLSGNFADKISTSAFISLPVILTFIFQRVTIIESVVFSFLFAAPIIHVYASQYPTLGSLIRPAVALRHLR